MFFEFFFSGQTFGHTFLERTLFTRNTTIPKSYIAGFRYVGDVSSTVIGGGIISSDAQVQYFILFLSVFSALFLTVLYCQNSMKEIFFS